MKKLMSILLLGALLLTGCEEAPKKAKVTPEYLRHTTEWCNTIIEQKRAIFVNVQTKSPACAEALQHMVNIEKSLSDIQEADPALGEICQAIYLSGDEFQQYLNNEGTEHWDKGVQYLNLADTKMQKYKEG
jgi:hypothetical protein